MEEKKSFTKKPFAKKSYRYGDELLAEVEEQIKRCLEDENRYAEEDLDECFVSKHYTDEKLRMLCDEKSILEGDGTLEFEALFDKDGKEARWSLFENKWGGLSCACHGNFASSLKALAKKTNCAIKTIRVPFWINSNGAFVRYPINTKTGEWVGYPESDLKDWRK